MHSVKYGTIIYLLLKPRLPPPNISPAESKALRELRQSHDLVILLSDKGRASVVLDRNEYDGRIGLLLGHTNTYRKLKKDPTPSLERNMNSLLLSLTKKGELPRQLYARLWSSAGQIPRLYGLPKVHKSGIPLRPIVSFINSPTYQLSNTFQIFYLHLWDFLHLLYEIQGILLNSYLPRP